MRTTWVLVWWHSFWIAGGSLATWALAAELSPSHATSARFIGAVGGAMLALVVPRLLVHHLIERGVEPKSTVPVQPFGVPELTANSAAASATASA